MQSKDWNKTFSVMAVRNCERAMIQGTVSRRHVNDVMQYDHPDVSSLEQFLDAKDPMVRKAAAEIVAMHGNPEKFIDAVLLEPDKFVLLVMLEQITNNLGKWGKNLERLSVLLERQDAYVKEMTIQMFRRVGASENLFPLIFEDDDDDVRRIKRYINQQSQKEL